jgi:hypothetical protein
MTQDEYEIFKDEDPQGQEEFEDSSLDNEIGGGARATSNTNMDTSAQDEFTQLDSEGYIEVRTKKRKQTADERVSPSASKPAIADRK